MLFIEFTCYKYTFEFIKYDQFQQYGLRKGKIISLQIIC